MQNRVLSRNLSDAEADLIRLLRERGGADWSIGIGRGTAQDGTAQFSVMLIRPFEGAAARPPDIGLGACFEDAWLARSGRED